jgi:hypothetical protein
MTLLSTTIMRGRHSVARDASVIDRRQGGDEILQRAQFGRHIGHRRLELGLEAREDLAVEAATVGLRARP